MDEIEKLAREHGTGGWQTLEDMMRFGRAVRAAERERCAKLCDLHSRLTWNDDRQTQSRMLAAEIRKG